MSQTNALGPIYAEQLNTPFRYTTRDGQTVEFVLTEFDKRETPPDRENFSLIFRAPTGTAPEQGTYRLEHDKLEPSEIFLVPVRGDQTGIYFEAVFFRFLS